MKKRVWLFIGLSVTMVMLLITGCNKVTQVEVQKGTVSQEIKGKERLLYSSEKELDTLASRGIGDVVDWKLAREFAEISFEDMVAEGTFAKDSVLRNLPIVVYDADGEMKYYEFRAADVNGNPVGAITTVAKESEGYPIAFRLLFPNNYSDTLEKLFSEGKVTETDMLKLVANDYPNYAIGVVKTSRSDENEIIKAYDNKTTELATNQLAEPIRMDKYIEAHPELMTALATEITEINKFKDEVKKFWEEAGTRKGNIKNAVSRNYYGGNHIPKYEEFKDIPYLWARNDCGPSACNFTLGYMNYRDFISGYKAEDKSKSIDILFNVMGTWGWGPTMPWRIPDGINYFAPGYKVIGSGWGMGAMFDLIKASAGNVQMVLPSININIECSSTEPSVKKSIDEDGIPGITLRGISSLTIDDNGSQKIMIPVSVPVHYRNVVGYKITGWDWGWFVHYRQFEMHVRDLNQIDNKGDGWEVLNPLYHLHYYRITRK